MLCITRARAHAHSSWTDAHSLINGHKEINKVSNCSGKHEEYCVKKYPGWIILRSAVTNENARACACSRFFIFFMTLRKALVKTIPYHYSTAVNGNLVGLDYPNFVSVVKTLRELLLLHRHQWESGGVGLPQFRFSR